MSQYHRPHNWSHTLKSRDFLCFGNSLLFWESIVNPKKDTISSSFQLVKWRVTNKVRTSVEIKNHIELKEFVKECFRRFNLQVNEEKTERTTNIRERGKTEKWRWTKKLGNLLGDSKTYKKQRTTFNNSPSISKENIEEQECKSSYQT